MPQFRIRKSQWGTIIIIIIIILFLKNALLLIFTVTIKVHTTIN
jgi:hypothetical protein